MRISIELELTPPTQAHSWQAKGYTASGAIDARTQVMAKVTCPVGPQPTKIKTTALERACLQYLAKGLRTSDIAKRINKSTSRVDHCLADLRTKLNCQKKTNVALVLQAIAAGVLDHV